MHHPARRAITDANEADTEIARPDAALTWESSLSGAEARETALLALEGPVDRGARPAHRLRVAAVIRQDRIDVPIARKPHVFMSLPSRSERAPAERTIPTTLG